MILGIFNGWLDPVYIGVVGSRRSSYVTVQKRGVDLNSATHVRVDAYLPVQEIRTDEPCGIKHVVLKDDALNISHYFAACIEYLAIGDHEIDLAIISRIVMPACASCIFYDPSRIIDMCLNSWGSAFYERHTDCEHWRQKE